MSPSWPENRRLPEFNMNEVRDIIFQWLNQIREKVAQTPEDAPAWERDQRLERIAAVAEDLKLVADKSSYLGRRFSGEIHRTQECPKHKGIWTGLEGLGNECEFGCELTGWLPRIDPTL